MTLKHPTSRNLRRQLKRAKDKFEGKPDRTDHVSKVLLEEKEILNELRSESKKAIQGEDTLSWFWASDSAFPCLSIGRRTDP